MPKIKQTTRKSNQKKSAKVVASPAIEFFSRPRALVAFLFIFVFGVFGYKLLMPSHALSNCTVSPILVNSCRPWLGAAIGGDPNAPSQDKAVQFNYLEKLIGRQLDVYHDYHAPGSLPLSADEIKLADRADTYDYVNWKPASNWADAGGSNASVNANIKKAADNIKAIAPHKIFLTVWHEPENDVSGFDNAAEATACKNDASFNALKGNAGTPAQYRAMWQNVRNIFDKEGVTNVVWVVNYMNYRPWQCLVTDLYPGNNLVDWVAFESYTGHGEDFQQKISDMYDLLQANNSNTTNFESKPWAIGEFNDCSDDATTTAQRFQELKGLVDTNAFPRLKMYMVYDSANGPGGTAGCLVDKSATELSAFKDLANVSAFTSSTPTPTPHNPSINTLTATPVILPVGGRSTIAWTTSNTASCGVSPGGPANTTATSWVTSVLTTPGTATYTLSCKGSNGTSVSKSIVLTIQAKGGGGNHTPPTVSLLSPHNGATVSGTMTVVGTASDNVGVTFVALRIDNTYRTGLHQGPYTITYDTNRLSNGKHTLYLRAWDAANNHTDTAPITITVVNHHWWWPFPFHFPW